jgi:hypothetical protein
VTGQPPFCDIPDDEDEWDETLEDDMPDDGMGFGIIDDDEDLTAYLPKLDLE